MDGKLVAKIGQTSTIDSGTTHTLMGTNVYKALRGAIEGYCKNHDGCSATQNHSCFNVKVAAGLSRFPNITWDLRSQQIVWEPRSYLFRHSASTTWCYAFQDNGPSARITLGAAWMTHKDVVFDMSRSMLGIAEARCPEYRVRPQHEVTVTAPTVYELAPPPQNIADPVEQRGHPTFSNVLVFVLLTGLTFCGCRLCLRRRKRNMEQTQVGVADASGMSPHSIDDTCVGAPSFVIGEKDDDDDDEVYDEDYEGDCQFVEGEHVSLRANMDDSHV